MKSKTEENVQRPTSNAQSRIRKLLSVFLLLVLLVPSAAPAATDTSGVYVLKGAGKNEGTYITGKTTDLWGTHGVAPTAQQAATLTAFQALQNKGIIASGTDYSIQHKTVSLTAANIIAMYATPVVLIAAPGSGKSIVVQRVAFTITRTSTAFTGGGAAIIQYASTANGGGTQALDSTMASTVITGAAGTTVTLRNPAVMSDIAAASIQNIGLYISNATAAFAAGTGTATVDIWYYVY